jgi:hypothetical protein
MKKIIILALFCGLMTSVLAQNTERRDDPTLNRRGIALLPEEGDFAIGVSANPFLHYLGGFMGGNSLNNGPTFGWGQQTLYGKYFWKDNTAFRVKLHLDFMQTKFKDEVRDDYALLIDPTNIRATTIDTRTEYNNAIDLNLGYEMRRGKGRVQGFYGGEVYLTFAKNRYSYEYGNPITVSNQTPSTSAVQNTIPGVGYRTLENKNGAAFGFGLGGFAGVEYFFTPQISLGGEINLGFLYYIKGQDEITTEGFLDNGVVEYNYRERNINDNAFETSIRTAIGAELFLMFHF